MPARILHLITELSNGGAQSALLRLLERSDRVALEPVVACYFNGDTVLANRVRALGVPVYDLGMQERAQAGALWRLFRLLRLQRPAILHTWMFHANVPGRILGRLARVPIIISSERTMGQESLGRQRLNRITAPLADRILCVSTQVRDYDEKVVGLPASKLAVIPNGVDLAAFRPKDYDAGATDDDDPVRIIYIGRLEPVKGVDVLLEAASQMKKVATAPSWTLTLVGDGTQRAPLDESVHATGLQGQVLFLGDRQDVPELLPGYDVAVLPSRWEGMPNVILESMACALPVVATAVGGTPEVVVDGETGLLVPPDDPVALADAITTLVQDPERRRHMGLLGRKRIEEHFSLAATVAQTEALYQELLQVHSNFEL